MTAKDIEASGAPACNQQDIAPDDALTIYFDGSCALCSTEIRHYQSLQSAAQLQFVDVSRGSQVPSGDLSREDAMRRFHVRRADGTLESGAAAFALLWDCLPAWRWAARLSRFPGIAMIMEGGYRATLVIRPALSSIATRLGARPFSGIADE